MLVWKKGELIFLTVMLTKASSLVSSDLPRELLITQQETEKLLPTPTGRISFTTKGLPSSIGFLPMAVMKPPASLFRDDGNKPTDTSSTVSSTLLVYEVTLTTSSRINSTPA